jgi:hypothetical protein
MNALSLQFKKVTVLSLTVFALGCLALLPRAQAVNPPSDGDSSPGDSAEGLGDNTAIGPDMLCNMMMMRGNTPYGCQALVNNAMGNNNTAIGLRALSDNVMGNSNTAIGCLALDDNAMGSHNTAIGFSALNCNTGSGNIALGWNAGTYHMAGNNNIYIGNSGNMTEDGQIRIGSFPLHTATYIAGIRRAAVTGSPVVIGMGGRLGVTMSSAEFKEAIKPMDKASEAILALKPVTFHYRKDVDPDGNPQFGLVAEEVEKVNPDLVVRDEDGKVMTVRYDAVNAMLLNEFLKEHQRVTEQQSTISELKATVAKQQKQIEGQNATAIHQQKRIEALTAGLQKVTTQVEAGIPAARLVSDN